MMGFSAGACLAAMPASQWNAPGLAEKLGVRPEEIRPNAAVIAYAPWDNTNTIQHDPKYYNPGAARIAKDCTPELDLPFELHIFQGGKLPGVPCECDL